MTVDIKAENRYRVMIFGGIVIICCVLELIALTIWSAFPVELPAEDSIRITDPGFSLPDQPIVFSVPSQTGNVFGFIDPDGSNFTTREISLRQGVVLVGDVWWGSDGASLVTLANNDILNEYERLPTLITNEGEVYICKDFSTPYVQGLDGTHLLTILEVAESNSVQIVGLNMETCEIETVIGTVSDGFTAISSDGWGVYGRYGRQGLAVLDDQHKEVFTIPDGAAPAWSKDGEWLTYVDYTGTTEMIYIVNRDGTDAQLITSGGVCPSWSSDGEWLIYNRYLDIYIVNIATKENRLLYSGGKCASWR